MRILQEFVRGGGVLAIMAASATSPAMETAVVNPGFNGEVAAQLPVMAPRVVAWARRAESEALQAGSPLAPELEAIARANGVRDPRRVRMVVVERVPLPDEPMLQAAALKVGMSQSTASGMTLGHAVFVRRGSERDVRLLSHELRHVAQYEEAGGIAPFLARHLVDLARHGYEDSPYEVDARAHEREAGH